MAADEHLGSSDRGQTGWLVDTLALELVSRHLQKKEGNVKNVAITVIFEFPSTGYIHISLVQFSSLSLQQKCRKAYIKPRKEATPSACRKMCRKTGLW